MTQLWGSLAPPTARCRPDSRRALFTVVYRSTGLPGTVATPDDQDPDQDDTEDQDPAQEQEGHETIFCPPTLPPQLEDLTAPRDRKFKFKLDEDPSEGRPQGWPEGDGGCLTLRGYDGPNELISTAVPFIHFFPSKNVEFLKNTDVRDN